MVCWARLTVLLTRQTGLILVAHTVTAGAATVLRATLAILIAIAYAIAATRAGLTIFLTPFTILATVTLTIPTDRAGAAIC